jgi:3-phytase
MRIIGALAMGGLATTLATTGITSLTPPPASAATTSAAAGVNRSAGAGAQVLTKVRAVAETAPNWDDEAGGDANADDPAIWVHPSRPARSVVLGALKNGGLTVVDLAGQELQHIATPPAPAPDTEAGRFNVSRRPTPRSRRRHRPRPRQTPGVLRGSARRRRR